MGSVNLPTLIPGKTVIFLRFLKNQQNLGVRYDIQRADARTEKVHFICYTDKITKQMGHGPCPFCWTKWSKSKQLERAIPQMCLKWSISSIVDTILYQSPDLQCKWVMKTLHTLRLLLDAIGLMKKMFFNISTTKVNLSQSRL